MRVVLSVLFAAAVFGNGVAAGLLMEPHPATAAGYIVTTGLAIFAFAWTMDRDGGGGDE